MVIVGLPCAWQGQMRLDEISGSSASRRLHGCRRRWLAPAVVE